MQTRNIQFDAIHHLACGVPADITAAWTGLPYDEVISIMSTRAAEIDELRFEYREQARIDEMFDARYAGEDE